MLARFVGLLLLVGFLAACDSGGDASRASLEKTATAQVVAFNATMTAIAAPTKPPTREPVATVAPTITQVAASVLPPTIPPERLPTIVAAILEQTAIAEAALASPTANVPRRSTPTPVVFDPNYDPPAYIKDVVAYKEGYQGFIVYFTLAGAGGALTTADGRALLEISTDSGPLMSFKTNVVKSDFVTTEVGKGAFARQSTLFTFGRMEYWIHFNKMPDSEVGRVKITFTTEDGRQMIGQTILALDVP